MTNYFKVMKTDSEGRVTFLQMIVSNSAKYMTDMALCRASRIDSTSEEVKALYDSLPDEMKAKWDAFTGGSLDNVSIIRG